MASEKRPSLSHSPSDQTGRHTSPPPLGLRHRPLGRASTFAEPSASLRRRRSSLFSETLSDTRKSLRESTDDLLLPRASNATDSPDHESSHWHSLPLGLALLPAVAGLIFKDGSAIVTDITLLGLAAIFMNWALRTPWDWYHAAQSVTKPVETSSPTVFSPINEEDEDEISPKRTVSPTGIETDEPKEAGQSSLPGPDQEKLAAERELRFHEMAALFSCILFPALAAWLLHGIRSQLSRPSEGLVSNYNLTIFLLVAEIRPISHILKMIQRRTLFLQRRVNSEVLQDSTLIADPKIEDLTARMEEIEHHVANGIVAADTQTSESPEALTAKVSAQAILDVKKTVQPELDALNRAMRRYEKRSTISAVQIETRLQDLETRLKDVVVLAAAAQRNLDRQPRNYVAVLTNWLAAVVVVPIQYGLHFLSLPMKALGSMMNMPKKYISGLRRAQTSKETKSTRRNTKPRSQERDRRSKPNP